MSHSLRNVALALASETMTGTLMLRRDEQHFSQAAANLFSTERGGFRAQVKSAAVRCSDVGACMNDWLTRARENIIKQRIVSDLCMISEFHSHAERLLRSQQSNITRSAGWRCAIEESCVT